MHMLIQRAVLTQSSYIPTCFSMDYYHHQGRKHYRPKKAPLLEAVFQEMACYYGTQINLAVLATVRY